VTLVNSKVDNVAMDSKTLLISLLSGSTAGAIVSAAWGHLSKLWFQKPRNERRSRRRYSRRSKRARQFSRANAGVVHALKPSSIEDPERVFTFSSWVNLRDRLRVFGLTTEQELDNADVRFSTKPYVFSSRRWEAPLIEPLDLTGPAANEDDLA
jgi:hypothetical protein